MKKITILYYNKAGEVFDRQETDDDFTCEERKQWHAWLNDQRTTPNNERFDQFEIIGENR